MKDQSLPKPDRLLIQSDVTYQEASELLRHYSSVRATIVTFLVSVSFGMGGWALSNMTNAAALVYLFVIEIAVYAFAIFISVYFSAQVNGMRKILIDIESGTRVNLYNRLDKVRIVSNIRLDPFDWIVIVGGIIVHIGMSVYLMLGKF
jgi:hypothetical protein